MNAGARFSLDKKYRYRLWRIWDKSKPLLAFCMLNPSIADETQNDPTVERCQRRAEQLGFGGIIVVNIFALISTGPKALKQEKDPVGGRNNIAIIQAVQEADCVICGWGKHGSINGRGKEVMGMISFFCGEEKLRALKMNKDRSPAHPLYIGYDVKPFVIDINDYML